MNEDLLICPFCGSKADIRKWSTVKAPDGSPGYLPYCTGCGFHPQYSFFTIDDAMNWWYGLDDIFKEEK